MKYTFALAALTSLASTTSLANKLSADINPDAFHIRMDAMHASNKLLYSGALLITTDSGNVASLAMRTSGQVGNNSSLTGGLGGKILVLDDENDTYAALALGGRLDYSIPELKGFDFSAEIFYAPSLIISGDDAESLIDLTLRVNYNLFENAAVYAGIRHLETEYENDFEHEFDSGPHVGINIDF